MCLGFVVSHKVLRSFVQVPPIRGLTVKVPASKRLSGLESEPAFGIGGWLVGVEVRMT